MQAGAGALREVGELRDRLESEQQLRAAAEQHLAALQQELTQASLQVPPAKPWGCRPTRAHARCLQTSLKDTILGSMHTNCYRLDGWPNQPDHRMWCMCAISFRSAWLMGLRGLEGARVCGPCGRWGSSQMSLSKFRM